MNVVRYAYSGGYELCEKCALKAGLQDPHNETCEAAAIFRYSEVDSDCVCDSCHKVFLEKNV